MRDAFDREFTVVELLPADLLDAVGPAVASLLGTSLAVLTDAGRPYWGSPVDGAAREVLVLEVEPLAYVSAAVAPERLAAAVTPLRELMKARARYLMACDLHTDVVTADYQVLAERNRALEASEARYKNLAEQLEQRVTEQVAMLDERQRQIYQAEKLASIGQLAAGVAHEINNPIGFVRSNIVTFGRYLERVGELKPRLGNATTAWREIDLDFILTDGAELVADCLNGIDRVARIVRDLKGFSSVDQPEEEVVDINESLGEACDVLASQLPVGVTLERHLGSVPRVLCLPGHMKQVFYNVIQNGALAVRDANRAGTVSVASRAVEGGIEIAISDTGVGMKADQIAHAFEPFFTTRPAGHGTGLGLTVARDIVQAHDGRIAIASRPGTGSTVTIFLPA
jgi:signal transduction histidine kinase